MCFRVLFIVGWSVSDWPQENMGSTFEIMILSRTIFFSLTIFFCILKANKKVFERFCNFHVNGEVISPIDCCCFTCVGHCNCIMSCDCVHFSAYIRRILHLLLQHL